MEDVSVDISNHGLSKIMRKIFEQLDADGKRIFEDFGRRMEDLRDVRKNLYKAYEVNPKDGTRSATLRNELIYSLRRDLERGVDTVLISVVGNNSIIFSIDGLGEENE